MLRGRIKKSEVEQLLEEFEEKDAKELFVDIDFWSDTKTICISVEDEKDWEGEI